MKEGIPDLLYILIQFLPDKLQPRQRNEPPQGVQNLPVCLKLQSISEESLRDVSGSEYRRIPVICCTANAPTECHCGQILHNPTLQCDILPIVHIHETSCEELPENPYSYQASMETMKLQHFLANFGTFPNIPENIPRWDFHVGEFHGNTLSATEAKPMRSFREFLNPIAICLNDKSRNNFIISSFVVDCFRFGENNKEICLRAIENECLFTGNLPHSLISIARGCCIE
uniref:Uncharacterized protein n=1 Tax=Lutzomyia longipalpis TaxID=7200 RepID=A0A1B0CUU9_LUTLO